MFQHCPLLASFSVENHTRAFEEFLQYKTRVPVRGAIMLNEAMDSTVLVKGWKKSANWSFPRGKINKDEDDLDCAVREVWEETGLDLRAAGLVPQEAKPKYIEISMREQQLRLYVFKNVPMDTKFAPQTRKEISKIQWYKLSELPAFRKKGAADDQGASPNANKFYMVAPFLVPLKKWVVSQKKHEQKRTTSGTQLGYHTQLSMDDAVTEDDMWLHPDPIMQRSTQGSAAAAMESATNELHRLLKVQPPTQGLQPAAAASQANKGSALLSILQAKEAGPSQHHQHPQAPLPHRDMAQAQMHQPLNPHHHNNQGHYQVNPPQNFSQPPADIPLGHGQQPNPWNYPQHQAGPPQAPPISYQSAQQQPHFAGQAADLVHPQPLPPQVQRAVFNQSAFQDGGARAPPQNLQQPSHHGAANAQQQPQFAGSGPLNMQSKALLNAFKRDPAPAVHSNENQRAQDPPAHSQHRHPDGSNYMQHNANPVRQPQIAQISQYAHQTAPVISPKELAGVGVVPQKPNHRDALLGMFKQASPQTSTINVAHEQTRGTPPTKAVAPDRIDPLLVPSFKQMSLKNGRPSPARNQVPVSKVPQQAPATHSQNQPPRILPRGQDIDTFTSRQHQHASPVSPGTATTAQRPGAPATQVPQQKQQSLLALFGKQGAGSPLAPANPQVAPAAPQAGGEDQIVPLSRIGSLAPSTSSTSRRGSETPISPADQNFLLGYLQSVTNNAAAR